MNLSQVRKNYEAAIIDQFVGKVIQYCNNNGLNMGEDVSIGEFHDSVQVFMKEDLHTEHRENVGAMLEDLRVALS